MSRPIRVLVADDSAVVRRLLGQVLAEDRRFDLVGFARDGVEAVERAAELAPDVITLDQIMPRMTGLEALPELGKRSEARVVMLSSVEDPDTAYAALDLGAVEFVAKPRGADPDAIAAFSAALRASLTVAFSVSPAKRRSVRAAADDDRDARVLEPAVSAASVSGPPVVVSIGASTGGPPALEAVFGGLAASDPCAYLVVQHLPEGFSASLARRLGRVSGIRCIEARNGQPVECGTAYVAPHGAHLTVAGVATAEAPVIALVAGEPRHGLIPAVDPLFMSVAAALGARSVGVLLTGMGVDGAQGLAAMRLAGAYTIAQDEATSAVWGMPGAAVRARAAAAVLPLDEIAAEVRRAAARVVAQ